MLMPGSHPRLGTVGVAKAVQWKQSLREEEKMYGKQAVEIPLSPPSPSCLL